MKKNINKNMSNKQLIIALIISAILYLCWNIYRNYFDATIKYQISTTQIEKKKTINLTIPYLHRNLEMRIYSRDNICTNYIKNHIINVQLYVNEDTFPLHSLELANLKYKDNVEIILSSKEKLKNCKIVFSIEDIALNMLLLILFAYIPIMLFLLSLLILLFRFIAQRFLTV